MKITKVNIQKSPELNDGLEDIVMEKLGQVVLITGKNGSGKSRILNKITHALTHKPTKNQEERWQREITDFKKWIGHNEIEINRIEELKAQLSFVNKRKELTLSQDEQLNAINEHEKQIAILENQLYNQAIETSEIAQQYVSVRFVPKNLILKDCNTFPKEQILNSANNIDAVGVGHLPEGVYAKIQVIQNRWFNATHQNSQVSDDEKAKAIANYEKLKELIHVFLNTSIGRTGDDEATLFGFPMGKSNLSDGQKVLIQFCLAIYSQEAALKDLILILDEPENHLHPSVIIETIDKIQKCTPNGQIWIATHSIPLLAHFDPSLIWYVENNKIKHAGKIPEKVLESLLGDEDEVAKLHDFISLPAQYATSRYAFECLIEPPAVMTGSKDPQSYQIRNELLKVSTNGKVRVLDFGAGQGRLISNIFDLEQSDKTSLIEKLEYIAYDKYPTYKEQCEHSIKKAFGTSEKKYFNDLAKMLSQYDKESFNVVIMCNVLHEIDPKEWLKLFSKDGIITSVLAENGLLLLVEDHQIPIGEKAYQKGFLVLDTAQIKELFKMKEGDVDFKFFDHDGKDRLKAHHIPKNCLIRIDENSRIAALKSLSTLAKEKILDIREKEQNYKNGKLHGFWTQQFANAQLNLSEFTAL